MLSHVLKLPHLQYRKIKKPTSSPKSDPRGWFLYAIECARLDAREKLDRWKWTTMKKRREDRLKYIAIYKKLKSNKVKKNFYLIQVILLILTVFKFLFSFIET